MTAPARSDSDSIQTTMRGLVTIGDRVGWAIQHAKEKGYITSARGLARLIGVSPSTVQSMQKPTFTRPQDLGPLRSLADACHVSFEWLLSNKGQPDLNTAPDFIVKTPLGETMLVDIKSPPPYGESNGSEGYQSPEEIESPYLFGLLPVPDPIDADLMTRLFEALRRAMIAAGEPSDFAYLMRGACMAYPVYKGKRFNDDDLVRHYTRAIEARRAHR